MSEHPKYEIMRFVNLMDEMEVPHEEVYGRTPSKPPKEIKEYLDQYVIGQHEAKKVLSTAVFNRDMRLLNRETAMDDITIDKSNVLMLGPTGSGKTYVIETLAKHLNIPYISEDATTFTSSGYVGRDLADIFDRILVAAMTLYPYSSHDHSKDYSAIIKQMAEGGIIYIDEVDKLKHQGGNNDVGTIAVQEELLKVLEGSVVQLGGTKSSWKKATGAESLDIKELDTSNILFIIGGSFYGIEEIVAKRVESSSMGFGGKVFSKKKDLNILHKVTTEDLIQFGIIPELIGRFPIQVSFNSLTEKDLVDILKGAKNNLIQQYTRLFHCYGREIVFSKRALKKIASLAIKSRTGARGLKRIMDASLRDIMFEAPSDPFGPVILVTASMITDFLGGGE